MELRVGNVRRFVFTQEQIKLTAGASLPMDSDFQKQHVKETLPTDISQDSVSTLISSISKEQKPLFCLPSLSCSFGAMGISPIF